MNMTNNPIALLFVLTGLTIVVAGLLMHKFPPKKINNLYGYRTKRSKNSQESWEFAQKYSANQLAIYGSITGLIGLALLFIPINHTNAAVIISLIVIITLIIIPIVLTEKELKKRFE